MAASEQKVKAVQPKPAFRVADVKRLRRMLKDLNASEQRFIEAGNTKIYPGSMRATAKKDAETLQRVIEAIESAALGSN